VENVVLCSTNTNPATSPPAVVACLSSGVFKLHQDSVIDSLICGLSFAPKLLD
jgi:hypothetical protein